MSKRPDQALIPNAVTDVTPSGADVTCPATTWRITVGGAGDVAVECYDGSTATFTAVAGQSIDLHIKKILDTGTTATGILALHVVGDYT